jgi:hypothetical protein
MQFGDDWLYRKQLLRNQRLIMRYLLAEGRLTSLVSRPTEDGRVLLDLQNEIALVDEMLGD